MEMRASPEIKIVMAQFEAVTLGPYQDGTHLSIGLGHNNPKLKPTSRTTVRKAFKQFAEDLVPREQRVNALLKVPVSQQLFDMLLSLHYQSGNRYFPAVAHLVNYNEHACIKQIYQFFAYTAGKDKDEDGILEPGEWRDGLSERRKQELKIGYEGDYGDLTEPLKLWRGPPVGPSEPYVLQPGDIEGWPRTSS